MRVGILVLTLNEIVGLQAIMPQINPEWYDELIIVDGGSTDGTIEYAKEHYYQLYIQQKPGLGAAYREGLKHLSTDVVITFSPDGNSDASRLPDLIDKMKSGYDIVTVSRYLDWAKSDDDDIVTRFGNWFFTKLFNFLFTTKLTDLLVLYRAFRRELIEQLDINAEAISWQTQLMCRAAKSKLKFGEIPGNEPKRLGGQRKMNPIINGISELRMIVKERFCK